MDVVSLSPLRASSFVWQAYSGTHALTVVVKATFSLEPGECVLAAEQEPIHQQDEHWNDDRTRSVVAPNDRVPYKPSADVILVGHAYAPGNQPVRSLLTRLVVGEVDKSIEVWCDRAVRVADGQIVEGSRFTRMPLRWERTAGDADSSNPTGVRPDAAPDAYGLVALPNLQPPGVTVSKRSDTLPPICYGPIAGWWPGRTRWLGRAAGSFPQPGWEEHPLPEGMDPAYFQAAPPDQLVAEIRPNEAMVLENLHPEHARLVTRLPGTYPRAVAERATGEREEVQLVADTLWIDTDRTLCAVVWRGRIGLRHAAEAGRISVSMERAEAPALARRKLDRDGPPARAPTLVPRKEGERSPVMPFRGASTPLPAPPSAPASSGGLPFTPAAWSGSLSESGIAFSAPSFSPPPAPPSAPAAPTFAAAPTFSAPPAPPSAPAAPTFAAAPTFSAPPAPPSAPAATAFTPPPPPVAIASAPASSSPWAGGAPPTGAPVRETIGTAVAATGTAALLAMSTDRAAQEGATAASNAAAGASAWTPPQPVTRPHAVEDDVAPEAPRELLQLLWYEKDAIARMRRVHAWKQLIADLDRTPRSRRVEVVDDAREPWEMEDRQEVLQILAKGSRSDGRSVEKALDDAIGEDGKFVAPLVLVGGEIELPFDELETLKATMSTAAPLVTPPDESLRAAVANAKEFVQLPGLAAAPAVSEGLSARIREAFVKEKKALPADYLNTQVERVLLSGRHYQKREVLGGRFLRCLVWPSGEKEALVGYLPEEVGRKLPMWRRFRARLVAEVHPAQDQYETLGHAVKVLGVARVGAPAKGSV